MLAFSTHGLARSLTQLEPGPKEQKALLQFQDVYRMMTVSGRYKPTFPQVVALRIAKVEPGRTQSNRIEK